MFDNRNWLILVEIQENSPKNRTTFETLCDALINGQINEQEVLDEFDNIYNPVLFILNVV